MQWHLHERSVCNSLHHARIPSKWHSPNAPGSLQRLQAVTVLVVLGTLYWAGHVTGSTLHSLTQPAADPSCQSASPLTSATQQYEPAASRRHVSLAWVQPHCTLRRAVATQHSMLEGPAASNKRSGNTAALTHYWAAGAGC